MAAHNDRIEALKAEMVDHMENDLFDVLDGWDGDQECMTFYNCRLKIAFGSYEIGSLIPTITIVNHPENGGKIQFCDADASVLGEWKLTYKVGNPIITETGKRIT